MRFGTKVWIQRGSNSIAGALGSLRFIKGTLIGRRGVRSLVRLEQNDVLANVDYCTQKGDIGMWDTSVVTKRT